MSIGAAAISGALGFGGSIASGLFGRSNARDAWRQQKKMLQTRYQYTMRDLKKAGLNPMLVMSQGPGSPGSFAQAPTPDFVTPLANSARFLKTGSEKRLVEAQEEAALASAEEIKARAQVAHNQARKSDLMMNAWLKDPGLASAAAYREAYGNNKIGAVVGGGKGFLDSLKGYLQDSVSLPRGFQPDRSGSEGKRSSGSSSVRRSSVQKESGVSSRSEFERIKAGRSSSRRAY